MIIGATPLAGFAERVPRAGWHTHGRDDDPSLRGCRAPRLWRRDGLGQGDHVGLGDYLLVPANARHCDGANVDTIIIGTAVGL